MSDEANGWTAPDDRGAQPPARGEPARPQTAPSGWVPPRDGDATAGTWSPACTAPAERGRGRALAGVALVTVLALAAGAFAVSSVAEDGAPATPEAAVEALFGALEDQDVLGVLDALAPGERQVYQPFVEDLVGELQRLDVLAGDLDLGAIDGVELEIEGLELDSAVLADGVSVVTVVGGTVTSTVDLAVVPVGSLLRELFAAPGWGVPTAPVTSTVALAEDAPFDIVVIDDHGWHVSLHHSIAELVRKATGARLPDFDAGIEPEGAATPEAAVRELVRAAADLDLRRVVALMPPGEMSALHVYAPSFLGEADQAIAELRADAALDVSVDRLDTEVARAGDTAAVTVTGFAASGSVDGEPFGVTYDGRCFVTTYEGETEEVCPDELGGRSPASSRAGVGARLGVVAVEHDGAWYVSPTRSILQVLLAVVGSVDRSDLEDPWWLLADVVGFGLPALTDGFGSDEDPYARCDALFDDLPLDATEEQHDAADRAWGDCYGEVSGG